MARRRHPSLPALAAVLLAAGALLTLAAAGAAGADTLPGPLPGAAPWWVWVLLLFCLSFLLGVLSLLGGMGGGTLFVAIVGGFFPFHLDFVRGASLMVALSGALSAGPGLLRFGMGDLRLSLPAALMTSTGAVLGALVGLKLPAPVVQTALGLTILGVAVILLRTRRAEYPHVPASDPLAMRLGLKGAYLDRATGEEVAWQVHRTPLALLACFVVGLMAGVFGIGGGWANTTLLNLLMGAPLKVAVGTSKLIVALTDTGAVWIYLHRGAILPLVVVPSILGMMLGSWVGVGILVRIAPLRLRYIVIALLLFAGTRSFLKGVGLWP